jgi:hypothetical protein
LAGALARITVLIGRTCFALHKLALATAPHLL